MAFGGNSLEQGSDAIFQFHCGQCVKDGKNSEAVKFCEECYDYLCQTCLNIHNGYILMRRHKLLTIGEIRRESHIPATFLPTNCAVHRSTFVEFYCVAHDAILCNKCCETSKHRSCSFEYLPKAAMKKRLKDETSKLKALCEDIKNKRLKDLTQLNEQNTKVKLELNDVEKDLLHCFNKAADRLRKEIESKTATQRDTIDNDIQEINIAKTYLASLLQSNDESEIQLFMDMHQAEPDVKKYNAIIKEIDERVVKEKITVQFNCFTKKQLENENCVGKMVDEQDTLYSDGDRLECIVKGLCQLEDGRILATDSQNRKLNVLDNVYKVRDYIKLPIRPHDVCQVDDNVVAISGERKIQFVSVCGKMSLKHDFAVDDNCRGITFCGNKLYVCCGGFDLAEGPPRIIVFDTSGQKLQEINDKDIIGRPLSLAKSVDEQMIFVADTYRGIVVLSRNGQLINTVTHPELKIPVGVCVGKAGEVYTFGYSSNDIFKLVPNAKYHFIEKMKIELSSRNALIYDRTYDRLFSDALNFVSVL